MSPLRDHGPLAQNWWGATIPTTNVTSTTSLWVGVHLLPTVPGRINGFRLYKSFAQRGQSALMLLTSKITPRAVYVASFYENDASAVPFTWLQKWFRPWYRITPFIDYYLWVFFSGGNYWRNTSALSAPVTRNGIEFIGGFTSTATDILTPTLTENTNANAIDILFQPD